MTNVCVGVGGSECVCLAAEVFKSMALANPPTEFLSATSPFPRLPHFAVLFLAGDGESSGAVVISVPAVCFLRFAS